MFVSLTMIPTLPWLSWNLGDGYKLHVFDQFSSGGAEGDSVNLVAVVIKQGCIALQEATFQLP
jgi:hypothetical protein